MSSGVWVLALVVATLAYVVVVTRRQRARAFREAHEAVAGSPVRLEQADATYLGLASKGLAQSSGQGCLVLTDEVLFYSQWEPRRKVRLGCDQVVAVTITTQHERPTGGRPLLKVTFEDDDERDHATWILDDPEPWRAALSELLARRAS